MKSSHKLNVNYLKKIQEQRIKLGVSKHHDYSAIVDAVAVGGVEGLAYRMFDKACRLLTLAAKEKKAKIKSESIRDTLLDMGNYADYGVALIDGKW